MNSEFLNSAPDDLFLATNAPLNIFLAYEDFSSGLHALRTFDMIFLDGEERPQLDTHNVWNFELLSVSSLRETAIKEAAAAHMVIISAHGKNELPPTVRQWLEGWVDARPEGPGALAVMLDGGSFNPLKRFAIEPYLQDCGRRAGMECFIQRVPGRHCLEAPDVDTGDWERQAIEILKQSMLQLTRGGMKQGH